MYERSSCVGFQSMKYSPKRRPHPTSSVSPMMSMARRARPSATVSGSQLWSAIRYSRLRPAAARIAATPFSPTSCSTKGMSTFVKMQFTSPGIDSPRLVHELRCDVHGVGERVSHGRLAVDRLLALPDLILGRRALDRHRVPDVAHAVANALVVTEHAARVDVRLQLHVDGVDGNAEHLGIGRDAGRH